MARLAVLAEAQWPALKPYRPQPLVQEFARSLRRELDLANECRNAERVAANLAALPHIVIARVYWEWTSARINVQQRIEGLPGERIDALIPEAGFDRALLARRGAHAVLKMLEQDGLYHADPHPGNVFYLSGNRIAFIDFGMVGRSSQRRREELLGLLLGLVERDAPAVADVLLDWAQADHGAELTQLERESRPSSISTTVCRWRSFGSARCSLTPPPSCASTSWGCPRTWPCSSRPSSRSKASGAASI